MYLEYDCIVYISLNQLLKGLSRCLICSQVRDVDNWSEIPWGKFSRLKSLVIPRYDISLFGSRIDLDSIHKIWIQVNWTQLVGSESTGSAGTVGIELSWALWKAVMLTLSWALTQSTWILSESEPVVYQKESKNRLHFAITIHVFLEPRRSTWELKTRHNERSCSRLVLYLYVYCITLKVQTSQKSTRYILKSVSKYYYDKKCTKFWY